MTRRRRKTAVALGLLVVLAGLSACMLPDFASQKQAGKYDPVDASLTQRPSAAALMPIAETQAEPHTCGLHAMRSLYAAYGLDPDRFELRFRLGTDQPAVRADEQSTGTLHPDLYRVLTQDGFEADPVDLDDAGAVSSIVSHLDAGQLALLVVYRGTYHWVLAAGGGEPGRVVVVDSLADEPVVMGTGELVGGALSVTLIEPADGEEPVDVADAHARGLAEMARLYGRK